MLKRWPPGDYIIFHPWRMAAEVKFSITGRDVERNLCCDSVCHLASLIKDYHCLLWYPLCLGVHTIQDDYKHPKLMNALWIRGGKHGDFLLCSFCFVIKNIEVKKKCFVLRLPWSILLGIDLKLKHAWIFAAEREQATADLLCAAVSLADFYDAKNSSRPFVQEFCYKMF